MFQAKLQMRLESGEPKCKNCKHWLGIHAATFGACQRVAAEIGVASATTLDLSVCSKWEMKDGQAKAEAASE